MSDNNTKQHIHPLLKQEVKIPQKGKYTYFQEFRDYNNNNPKDLKTNYKKIYNIYQTQQFQKEQEHLQKKDRYYVNPSKLGEVQKMDNFLKYNQYGSPYQQVSKTYIYNTQSVDNSGQMYTQNSKFSQTSQGSNHFFMGGDRFDQKQNHLKQTGFDNHYSNINHLASKNYENKEEISKQLQDQNYTIRTKRSPTRPDIHVVQDQSFNSKQRREDFIKNKELVDEHKKWHKEYSEKIKRQRILEGAYRSGVLSVDSPENPQTNLYKQKQDVLSSKQKQKTGFVTIREQQIAQNQITNQGIEFNNRNLDHTIKKEKNLQKDKRYNSSVQDRQLFEKAGCQILDRTGYTDNNQIDKTTRKVVKQPFMDKFSQSQQMFIPKNDCNKNANRVKALVYQDSRDRDYNILSYVKVQ